ncbi:MAG: phosphotransferase, partial [Bacteroidota bacterium]
DNRGDAWTYFQERTERYFRDGGPVDEETLGRARLLGQRTAEMHLALGAGAGAMLTKEPLTSAYRREISGAAAKLLRRQVKELAAKKDDLLSELQALAARILAAEEELARRLSALEEQPMDLDLIRIHADYHLGQVLVSEGDFCIIDFEGEPLLSIPERRRKRPALKDVAGMVRSFHYAARGQLLLNDDWADRREELVPRAEAWFRTVSSAYLDSYYAYCGDASFLPASASDREALLDLFVLEKAVYEVAYELNSRPKWLGIPLNGVLAVLA